MIKRVDTLYLTEIVLICRKGNNQNTNAISLLYNKK